jgi:hypothetical protein
VVWHQGALFLAAFEAKVLKGSYRVNIFVYSAYNPAMLTKMADIYHVYDNYVNKNDKG